MEKEIMCSFCSKYFVTSANAAKYCSIECRKKAGFSPKEYKRHLTCAYCARKFDSLRRKKYCSDDCRLRANGRSAAGVMTERIKPKLSLEDVARLSSKAGMSYGKYVLANNL